jgi:tRNA pseudouridine38-40 synthase
MPLWKLTLAYDGTHFNGWQIQPHLPTIQGTLARALHHITGESVLPQGSGRTDTGVHALGQVASFALDAPIPPANLLRALNRALPPAIRILSAEHASPNFHARHAAQRKTYEYRIFPRIPTMGAPRLESETWEEPPQALKPNPDLICPPFLAPYVWDCPWPIDLALAQQAANQILGDHDFTSFAASDPDLHNRSGAPTQPASSFEAGSERSNIRTIFSSTWHRESNLVLYRVTGSGFLHHMVRNLVGSFVDAAAGRISPDSIPAVLATRSRSAAGPTAPARGLFLLNVEY